MELTFFEFRGRNLVCFVIAYNFNGKFASEAGKTRMRTAFFTRAYSADKSRVVNETSSVGIKKSHVLGNLRIFLP